VLHRFYHAPEYRGLRDRPRGPGSAIGHARQRHRAREAERARGCLAVADACKRAPRGGKDTRLLVMGAAATGAVGCRRGGLLVS